MRRTVKVATNGNLRTFYLSYRWQEVEVYCFDHQSKHCIAIGNGHVTEEVQDGTISSFGEPSELRLLIFVQCGRSILYAWLYICDSQEMQDMNFTCLKLPDSISLVSNANVFFAPSKRRFGLTISNECLLFGEEIKKSLLGLSGGAAIWVTDFGVMKNYVTFENEAVVSVLESSFSEDTLFIKTKDNITQQHSLSYCEIDWLKKKIKCIWRLPLFDQNMLVVPYGSNAGDGKVALAYGNIVRILSVEGQDLLTITLPDPNNSILSLALLAFSSLSSNFLLCTDKGHIVQCSVSNLHYTYTTLDVIDKLTQITDFHNQFQTLAAANLYTDLQVLLSGNKSDMIVIASNCISDTLLASTPALNEYQGLQSLGYLLRRTKDAVYSNLSVHKHRQIGLNSITQQSSLLYELLPAKRVEYINSQSIDTEHVNDFETHLIVVNSQEYLFFTSRLGQLTSVLNVTNGVNYAPVEVMCSAEYTLLVYSLSQYIIQITSSMLTVYNYSNQKTWQVAWNALASASLSNHKIVSLTVLFAVYCHTTLYLYCTTSRLIVRFNMGKLDIYSSSKGIEEVAFEEYSSSNNMACISSSTYINANHTVDYIVAKSYWDESKISIEYHTQAGVYCNYIDIPMSRIGEYSVVKVLEVILYKGFALLLYEHSSHIYLHKIMCDSGNLSYEKIGDYKLHPSQYIVHLTKQNTTSLAAGFSILLSDNSILEVNTAHNDKNIRIDWNIFTLPYSVIKRLHKHNEKYVCVYKEPNEQYGLGYCKDLSAAQDIGYNISKTISIQSSSLIRSTTSNHIIVYSEHNDKHSISLYALQSLELVFAFTLSSNMRADALPIDMELSGPNLNLLYTFSVDQIRHLLVLRAYQIDYSKSTLALVGKANCPIYYHSSFPDSSLFYHSPLNLINSRHLVIITNLGQIAFIGWDKEQYKILCSVDLSNYNVNKLIKVPFNNSAVYVALIHSLIVEKDFVLINFTTGKVMVFQCKIDSVKGYSFMLLLELSVERPVLAIHTNGLDSSASYIRIPQTISLLAYSKHSTDLYVYAVSLPSISAEDGESTLDCIYNPSYVLNKYLVEPRIHALQNNHNIHSIRAIDQHSNGAVYSSIIRVAVKSVERIEHSDEYTPPITTNPISWLFVLDNTKQFILQIS